MLPSLALAGFHPDPTVVRVGSDYYVATSSFEYLPGLPIHHSRDLEHWTLVNHVAVRPEQIEVECAETPGGVWAPTLRYRDGVFYLIVTVMGGRGCVLFRATDPAGAWDAGVVLVAVDGIDPDLAWDEDGTAYVTYTSWGAIRQVRVDLETGTALEPVRELWAGTGRLAFSEAPHLVHRSGWWYLLVAEGGTDRGHAVSVARSRRPDGPFEPNPNNPVLTSAGSDWSVQNQGHGDLVDLPDGSSAMVLLGVRAVGLGRSFSPLGRETFVTPVDWVDGWPVPRPIREVQVHPQVVDYDFADGDVLDDPEWVGIRRLPASFASRGPAGLVLAGEGSSLDDLNPVFVGQRQRHVSSVVRAVVDVSAGIGGLAVRIAEDNWYGLEARTENDRVIVTARAVVSSLDRNWEAELPAGGVEFVIEHAPPPEDFSALAAGGDRIRLLARSSSSDDRSSPVVLTELDGRHWSFETSKAFTGRVFGAYATTGTVTVERLSYAGC